MGVVEALTTVEYEVKFTLGNVRGQTADEEGAHFFFGGQWRGRIGNSGGCVGFETG